MASQPIEEQLYEKAEKAKFIEEVDAAKRYRATERITYELLDADGNVTASCTIKPKSFTVNAATATSVNTRRTIADFVWLATDSTCVESCVELNGFVADTHSYVGDARIAQNAKIAKVNQLKEQKEYHRRQRQRTTGM
jgi:hypothetical protein